MVIYAVRKLSLDAYILRACRAAVAQHAVKDYLAVCCLDGDSDFTPLHFRMWELSELRKDGDFIGQPRRTVADCITDAEVLGRACDIDPKYCRSGMDGVVIQVRYATHGKAVYEVGPGYCDLWMD